NSETHLRQTPTQSVQFLHAVLFISLTLSSPSLQLRETYVDAIPSGSRVGRPRRRVVVEQCPAYVFIFLRAFVLIFSQSEINAA
ncbi:hypothetical protein EDD85DRAFT_887605, partial [Armillaria nabsnona]